MNDEENNPRIQCELCGKWRRLYDSQGNQLSFPLYSSDFENDPAYEWMQDGLEFNSLCVWCHLLFGFVCLPFEEVESELFQEVHYRLAMNHSGDLSRENLSHMANGIVSFIASRDQQIALAAQLNAFKWVRDNACLEDIKWLDERIAEIEATLKQEQKGRK